LLNKITSIFVFSPFVCIWFFKNNIYSVLVPDSVFLVLINVLILYCLPRSALGSGFLNIACIFKSG